MNEGLMGLERHKGEVIHFWVNYPFTFLYAIKNTEI